VANSDKKAEYDDPTTDENAGIKDGSLVPEKEGEHTFYDALMLKVDTGHGLYGINNFYRMQVIYDPRQDVYILFTRWGRIGETGMYQRTPYGSKEETIKEFIKLFHEKTGNKWQDRSDFKKQHGKWRLINSAPRRKQPSEVLKPWKLKKCPKSKLDKKLQRTMKVLTSVSLYRESIRSMNFDTGVLPLDRLDPQFLQNAKEILNKIQDILPHLKKEQESEEPNHNHVDEYYDNLTELSSQYYELVPHKNFKHDAMKILSDKSHLNKELSLLDQLTDFVIAAKILLAASHQKRKISPLDYTYKALGATLDIVEENSAEFNTIVKYASNDESIGQIQTLYRVGKEAPHGFDKWAELSKESRYILWHGSGAENLIGILAEGLKIAPPTSNHHGSLYGKGIYFTDMATKATHYAKNSTGKDTFLLLCDVALGNIKDYDSHTDDKHNKMDKGHHSIRSLGKRGPDYDQTIVLHDGAKIPIGAVKKYDDDKKHSSWNDFTEFVVFDPTQVRIRYMLQIQQNDD